MKKLLILIAIWALCTVVIAHADTLTLPSSLTVVEEEAFFGDASLDEVVLPEGVRAIGARAFAESSVSAINLPASLESIADDALPAPGSVTVTAVEGSYAYQWAVEKGYVEEPWEASPLEDFVIEDGVLLKYVGYGGDVVIPREDKNGNPVVRIGLGAFSGNEDITGIAIPNTVSTIEEGICEWNYRDCGVFKDCINLNTIILSNGLIDIGAGAFYGCDSLESVSIPESVERIGNGAFRNCHNLKEILLPSKIEQLSKSIFCNCINLKRIDVPEGVTNIDEYAFYGCTSLESLTLPSNNFIIGFEAFSYCSNLKNVSIIQDTQKPNFDSRIGSTAFSYCTSLTSITIPNTVTSIGDSAFECCTSLTSIVLPSSVTSIEHHTFAGCTSLRNITLPACLNNIKGSAFMNCTDLTSITIPTSVTSIGNAAFWNCTNLESITLPSSVNSIEKDALSNCPNLTAYVQSGSYAERYCKNNYIAYTLLDDGLPEESQDDAGPDAEGVLREGEKWKLRWRVFSGVQRDGTTPYTRLEIYMDGGNSADGVIYTYTEDDGEFPWLSEAYGYTRESFTHLVLKGRYTNPLYIVPGMFKGYSNLRQVKSQWINAVASHAFEDCGKLEYFNGFENTLKAIGEAAFRNCVSLKDVRLSYSDIFNLVSVGKEAFRNTGLHKLLLYKAVNSIGDDAFADCPNLMLTVVEGTYAEQWCRDHGVNYRLGEDYEALAQEQEEQKKIRMSDYARLCQYCNDASKKKSESEMLDYFYDQMKTFPETHSLRADIAVTRDKLLAYRKDDMEAIVIRTGAGKAIVVFAGTNSFMDILQDAFITLGSGTLGKMAAELYDALFESPFGGFVSAQSGAADSLLDLLYSLGYRKLVVTGHSLGGFLAVDTTLYNRENIIEKCYAFDPVGHNEWSYNHYMNTARAGRITNYICKGSTVSSVGQHIGTVKLLEVESNGSGITKNHDIGKIIDALNE